MEAATVEGGPEGGREGGVGAPLLQTPPRLDHILPRKDGESSSRLAASKIPHQQGPKLVLPPSLPPLTFSGGGGREGGKGVGLQEVVEAVMRGGGIPQPPQVEPLVSKRKGGREGRRKEGREDKAIFLTLIHLSLPPPLPPSLPPSLPPFHSQAHFKYSPSSSSPSPSLLLSFGFALRRTSSRHWIHQGGREGGGGGEGGRGQ